jgi:hypothetical protein
VRVFLAAVSITFVLFASAPMCISGFGALMAAAEATGMFQFWSLLVACQVHMSGGALLQQLPLCQDCKLDISLCCCMALVLWIDCGLALAVAVAVLAWYALGVSGDGKCNSLACRQYCNNHVCHCVAWIVWL